MNTKISNQIIYPLPIYQEGYAMNMMTKFGKEINRATYEHTCDTVEDFEKFKTETGMELRYAGLITFEKDTGIFKGCVKNEDGSFSWVNLNMEHQGEIVEMTKALDDLQERISSVMLEFEESVRMMNLEF